MSSSLSMMMGLGSRHTRSSAFSSDFIPIGQAKGLVRIQVWDSRFRVRLSRRTVVGSGRATGRSSWPTLVSHRRNATISMRRRGTAPARALSSNCLRSRHDWRRFGGRDQPPCDGRDTWRKRCVDPWAVGFRQERAGAGADGARDRRRRFLRAGWGRPSFCPQGGRSSDRLGSGQYGGGHRAADGRSDRSSTRARGDCAAGRRTLRARRSMAQNARGWRGVRCRRGRTASSGA